jgi:hypothetical protein
VAVKKLFSWLIFVVLVVYGSTYLLHHFPLTTEAQPSDQFQSSQSQAATPQPSEAAQANKAVTFVGPLADYVQGDKTSNDNPPPAGLAKPNASDLVVDSPAGTGGVILHKTFTVAATVKFIFEIPAHATNPELHGTYRSSLAQVGSPHAGDGSSEGDSNVEFLLMNAQQYADFLRGRRADVLYFVESSHSQQVSFDLAPTYDKPAQYCLVFRNRSGPAKKVVQANFSVDF